MNRTERSSMRVWMWPFWFCSSIELARPPVRCMLRPGGGCVVANVARSATTAWSATFCPADAGICSSTRALRARPLADAPWSTTVVTRGTARMASSARSMAVSSAAVSWVPEVAATNVVLIEVAELNGPARA